MLTGQRPFQGKTYHEQLAAIINQPFALEGERTEASALNIALQKSLAKEANDRFASAREMQEQTVSAIRRYAQAVEMQTLGFHDQTLLLND